MEKTRIMPEGHWYWSMPVTFSQGWKVGNMIIVGGQVSADEQGRPIGVGDIEVQTRNVFESVRKVLNEVGADMKDIVKLNTFYVCNATGDAAKEFWEKMTRVRMEFLPDPGPAATGIPVTALAYDGLLIEVEAIAIVGE